MRLPLKVKNTFDIQLAGKPSLKIRALSKPNRVGVEVARIPYIKPKLAVKEGDRVKIGRLLFYDKNDPQIQFLSPGGGVITKIVFGERHQLQTIEITLGENEGYETFRRISINELGKMPREEVAAVIAKGGCWAYFRQFPLRVIPSLNEIPPAIYVTLDNDEPYSPQSEVFLKNKIEEFKFGIEVLKKLANGNVKVGTRSQNEFAKNKFESLITHTLSGDYPAQDPGVFLYYAKTSANENKSWYIKGQDLLLIAELLMTGKYPIERVIVLAGCMVKKPQHFTARTGISLEKVLEGNSFEAPVRVIAGGVFTGYQVTEEGYLGFYETAVQVLQEGKEKEDFLPFLKLGQDKASFSRAFLSKIVPAFQWKMDTSLNGNERACIECGHCPQVCPVEILPQTMMKWITAGETESAIKMGFLDCTSCGLCTYVCPSKIELDSIFEETREILIKELHK